MTRTGPRRRAFAFSPGQLSLRCSLRLGHFIICMGRYARSTVRAEMDLLPVPHDGYCDCAVLVMSEAAAHAPRDAWHLQVLHCPHLAVVRMTKVYHKSDIGAL